MGMGPLCGLFPRPFKLVVNKESFVSDCFEVRNGCIVWGVSFRRTLWPLERVQYAELLSILANTFFFCRDSKDSRIWKPSTSGEFSTKAFYLALERTHSHRATSSLVWLGLAPSRVEAFCWLAVAEKVHMVDNLKRRELTSKNISNTCMIYCRNVVRHISKYLAVAVV